MFTDKNKLDYVLKLYNEELSKVAGENNLGKTLVTGHRKQFFEKAATEMGLRLLSLLLSQSIASSRIQKLYKNKP